MGGLELIALAWLFLQGKKGNGGKGAGPAIPKGPAEPIAVRADDGAKLVARANQQKALEWVETFKTIGVPQQLAEALARWIGIESSGDPLAVSRIGERGLLQATRTTALVEKALTPREWDELILPSTRRETHARTALKLGTWLFKRARRHVANPVDDAVNAVWFAKLYHQRPVDVRDGKMHGPAQMMARELADRWKADPKRMHRLRAANVVAFGMPEP